MSNIDLESVKRLEKRLGVWVWDAVFYRRDAIVNPELTILPNEAGARLRRILMEIGNRTPSRKRTLFTYTES